MNSIDTRALPRPPFVLLVGQLSLPLRLAFLLLHLNDLVDRTLLARQRRECRPYLVCDLDRLSANEDPLEAKRVGRDGLEVREGGAGGREGGGESGGAGDGDGPVAGLAGRRRRSVGRDSTAEVDGEMGGSRNGGGGGRRGGGRGRSAAKWGRSKEARERSERAYLMLSMLLLLRRARRGGRKARRGEEEAEVRAV